MSKDRAIEIIQAAMYSDPMMDEVVIVKGILGKMPKQDAILLIGVASGTPIQVYRDFCSYKISDLVRVAAEKFIEEIDKVYVR